MRRLLFADRGRPRLVLPAFVTLVVTVLVGFGIATLHAWLHVPSLEARAERLASEGRFTAAEALYRENLVANPTIPNATVFIENHEIALLASRLAAPRGPAPTTLPEGPGLMSEDAVDALLEHALSGEDLLPARFWRGVVRHKVPDEVRAAMVVDAGRTPPLPFRNHLLAREDKERGRPEQAAAHFEREARAFPARAGDMDAALSIWIELGAWETVAAKLTEPRVSELASPSIKYRVAVHARDWPRAVRSLAAASIPHVAPGPLLMTAVAACAWLFFCVRLGDFGERRRLRAVFYALAFLLGVLSVLPTVALIAIEESLLRLVETGEPARDILFFTFGVGLREEASKLLLFLPLLWGLRRWGTKGDVLVCGALVGLGFAAEENLSYLGSGSLSTGLDRFLTANFLHMAMTGIVAAAVDDFITDPERNAQAFLRATLMVVGLHGAYDFFLSHDAFGGTYLAMGVFVVLANVFLAAVSSVRRRPGKGLSVLHAFVIAAAVVTGTGLVYGASQVGLVHALSLMTGGLLGEAIIVLVFVRTLRSM